MAKDIRKRMSDFHEARLAERFGARRTCGSGNQFRDQMDARQHHLDDYMAFAVDGKSTFHSSITVTLAMWEKAKEQAHGERPMLGLMFFGSGRLNVLLDLVVIDADDAEELIDRSRRLSEIEARD